MADDEAYCTSTQVKYFTGAAVASTVNDNFIAAAIPVVQDYIDKWTGTWFNQRSKTIYIKASTAFQPKLFMPAPIISITSIDELSNTLDTDEYLYGEAHLEKANGTYWTDLNYTFSSVLRYGVKVVGVFGYATVPSYIMGLCAEMTAIVCNLKVKTFTTGDGIQQTVNMSTWPQHITDALNARKRINLSGQPRLITATPAE